MPITMKVKDVMDEKVFALDCASTVDAAIRKMVENDVWSLVVEKKGTPWGVVTERDVLRRCLAKGLSSTKTQVEAIASSPLLSIEPGATVRGAMDIMASKGIRRLFVIDKGKLIGRVTQTDLFQSTLSVMEILSSLTSQA